jgi:osmotically inducible protein OsmC
MAVESSASATWDGELIRGRGSVRPASGAFAELPLSWSQRAESRESGTSPEELLAAAHAGCFAMSLAFGLESAGRIPKRLETRAVVAFQAGAGILWISLSVRASVPEMEEAEFLRVAEAAKVGCPVSRALAGVPITLGEATLL